MSQDNENRFIWVKDPKGQKYLCPINATRKDRSIRLDADDDCIEEEVIGRYSGNIGIKPS
jgi:hypothetical protein